MATASPPPRSSVALGLAEPIAATVRLGRWLVRDPSGAVRIEAVFASDPVAALPRVRVGDTEAPFSPASGLTWSATAHTTSATASGRVRVELVQRLRGGDATTFAGEATLTHGVFVVWTLDHEGYDEPDDRCANVAAVARAGIPLSLLFHPRVLIPGVLSDARRAAVAKWVADRASLGDEIGMHLHMQFDFVRDAGVTPRTAPRWGGGAGDGYDVPLTAYEEDEQRRLIARGLSLMSGAGLPRPASFRGGGQFADARTLRVLAAAGFTVDTSAHDAGAIGALRWPWTIEPGRPPYHPSPNDANAEDVRGLPLVEVPNTAGNTYTDDDAELRRRQALLWDGGVARRPIVLDYVSHPSTFVATERAKVESVFAPLLAARADQDAGPVRFARLVDLARLFG